ncbi:hypothetical protein GQ457_16G021710 [Hibiscus cannabinus]
MLSERSSTWDSWITYLHTPPLLFRRHPPQKNYPPHSVLPPAPKFSVQRLIILRRKSGLSGLVVVCHHLPHIRSSRWYSASSWSIQFHRVHVGDRGSHYTIIAFRVTTAIYRGFHSKLITLLLLTFQHQAEVSDSIHRVTT